MITYSYVWDETKGVNRQTFSSWLYDRLSIDKYSGISILPKPVLIALCERVEEEYELWSGNLKLDEILGNLEDLDQENHQLRAENESLGVQLDETEEKLLNKEKVIKDTRKLLEQIRL